MSYSKVSAIYNLIIGLVFIGFAVYFILCSFVFHIDYVAWKHFVWGILSITNTFMGAANVYSGIKELIKCGGKSNVDDRR